jgi:hypothetical protein
MNIKPTTAFRAYRAASRARANEGKSFMVKALNKDGSVSKMAPTASNWQLDAFVSAEDAERRRTLLETMNPGRRFAVVSV